MLLQVEALNVAYDGLKALVDVSIAVEEEKFISIVGPNGAGKTTLFKAISGTVRPTSGSIRFDGVDLLDVQPPDRARLGIAHVPEGAQVFKTLTVLENLEMGCQTRRARAAWANNLDRIFTLFPVLAQRQTQLAGTLSGGEQQMVAIGRGLASEPRLMILDEPSMGLSPANAELIFERIVQIHRTARISVLLVEQRVIEALESCDRGYVFESGRVVLEGSHEHLTASARVKSAYLGM